MNNKRTKDSFAKHGVFNLSSPLLGIVIASGWGMLVFGIFSYLPCHTSSERFVRVIAMIPMLISPVSCICGIVRGAVHFKKNKSARSCIIFSVIGLMLFIVIMIGFYLIPMSV